MKKILLVDNMKEVYDKVQDMLGADYFDNEEGAITKKYMHPKQIEREWKNKDGTLECE